MAEKKSFTVDEVCKIIEDFAPVSLQENYDNVGLLVGSRKAKISAALLTLDCTEAVINEAIKKKCQLIIAHHPIIFSGLKRINDNHYVERVVTKAIKNDIAIYACHTNIDNYRNGVNAKIAQKLGLINTEVLAPKADLLCKLYTYVPLKDNQRVQQALFDAGAGHIGEYAECSFQTTGIGTFKPSAKSNPQIGKKNVRSAIEEMKLEVLVPTYKIKNVLQALKSKHPYEEVAYEIIKIKNKNQEIGSGLIGELPKALSIKELLKLVKSKMKTGCIRHTAAERRKFSKIAICGGAGSFLTHQAMAAGAHAYITADVKYHEFFESDNKMSILDIGHYESEQYTPRLFYDILSKKLPTFALHLSKINTNPIKYF